MTTVVINGACHCGALGYALNWPATAGKRPVVPARRCSCSFCTRQDGVWTSHPEAVLEISEDSGWPPKAYRFGTGTADFLFCSRCGISPLVVGEISGQEFAVVNVNTFDDASKNRISLEYSDSCFDGESTSSRLDRRKQRWIGAVRRTRR